MKRFFLTSLPLLAASCLATAAAWQWHSFPGQGHYENDGPWGPYQGTDRGEWISAFGSSPVLAEGYDSPFMLMANDLGAVVYSADGESFIPADLPYSGGVAVGFDPHNGNTGYAIIHKLSEKQRTSLYRTRDRGKSWEYLTEATYYRGQRNLIAVNPDPARADHIYIGTTAGVKRSLDDGQTWERVPETDGIEVRTLHFNADGSSLYIVDSGINLHRMDTTGPSGSYTFATVLTVDCRDIRPHPDNPETGIIFDRFRRAWWFSERGATKETEITPEFGFNKEYYLINPANPDHLLAIGEGRFPTTYEWSLDGGQSWSQIGTQVIDGVTYFPAFTDYAPFNHGSPNGWLFDRTDTKIEGARHLFGFWPGQESWVVNWSLNKPKAPLLSTDYGTTWTPFAYGGLFKETNMMDIGSTDDLLVIARVEQGLVDTKNGGLWWRGSSPQNVPILGEIQLAGDQLANWVTSTMHGIAIDPEDDDHWIGYYGNGPAWILRTRDGGDTWEKVFETDLNISTNKGDFPRRWVYWHRQNPDIIYVGRYKSTDRGLTWSELPNSFGVSEMSSENGDILIYRNFELYWFSRDAGESWHRIPSPVGPFNTRYEIANGRTPGMVAIDPDPLRDPTVPGQFLRFLVGGRDGVYEFQATNQDATEGTWTPLRSGFVLDDDPWVTGSIVTYFTQTVFDPRPGKHHIAYTATGLGFNGTDRLANDKYRRQLYRSGDGGLTWSRLLEPGTESPVPEYIQVTGPLTVSRNTGKLYVNAWSGMYVYDPEAATTDEFWYGYPVLADDWAEAAGWLGWVNVTFDPYIWNLPLNKYLYVPDDSGWIYAQP